jgi:anti-sigma factor RsiW
MTCQEFAKSLMAFVSGELAEEDQRRLQRHARQCPLCADEVDSYQRVMRLGHLLPILDPPPEILERLRAALQAIEETAAASPDTPDTDSDLG